MPRGPRQLALLASVALVALTSGCHLVVPEVSHQPVVHNPFPQLSRVAVLPFFNQSAEPTVNGREFALAYFAELQGVPGFEVVPLATVEAAIQQYQLSFPPDRAEQQLRFLARQLEVDAVVVGVVTDYGEYYPPRCGLRVEWYAANEGFHEIPAGYGLPWGTPDEEFIPDRVLFDAEMALARAQMETQSPVTPALPARQPAPAPTVVDAAPIDLFEDDAPATNVESLPPPPAPPGPGEVLPAPTSVNQLRGRPTGGGDAGNPLRGVGYDEAAGITGTNGASGATAPFGTTPAGWPDARGFTPPGPSLTPPVAVPHRGPIMTHTRVYRGSDPEFTSALAAYVDFRDDARFGGWRSYLDRSEDFVRFCCHLHLVEMLTARGGVDETRVVRRWSEGR